MNSKTIGMYIGLFLINVITPTLLFLYPARATITIAAAAHHNLWLVTSVATIGSTLGLIPVYELSRRFSPAEQDQQLNGNAWMQKLIAALPRRMFLTTVILNILPLPDLVSCLLAGIKRYPRPNFFLAAGLGRFGHILPLAALTAYVKSVLPVIPEPLKNVIAVVTFTATILTFVCTVLFLYSLWRRKNSAHR